MNVSQLLNNFSAGEFSPLYMGRADTAAYNYGARRLEDFIPMLTGGLMKRPGSYFAGAAAGQCRLFTFQLSSGYVIMELSNLKARFWTSSFAPFGAPLEVTTPWTTAQLPDVKGAVSKNELWITHPSVTPRKITWNGSTFSISTPTFTGTAFLAAGTPSAVAFDSGRLWFLIGNGIWGSKAPDASTGADRYTDFSLGTNAGDAIYIQENDTYGSSLRWIAANRRIIAGSDRAVWTDTGDVPTPATFDMNIVSYSGASTVQAAGSKDVLVYIGRDGKSLHALAWNASDEKADYIPLNVTQSADHILIGGVVDLCVMDFPIPIVWMTRTDGTLVSCTLDLRGGVIAFARHNLGGIVESAAVGPGAAGDTLFLSVNRSGTRYIEYILFNDLIDAPMDEAHYVDSGLRFTYGSPTATVTGLNHLAGKQVRGVGDGAILPALTVSSGGEVTLPRAVEKLHIGLSYESILIPTSPEIPANGTSLGKKRQIEKAWVRLYNSYGGKMGTAMDKLQPLLYERFGGVKYGDGPEPFTGDMDLTVSGLIDTAGNFIVKHDDPAPFTILALILKVKIMEV